MLSVGSLVVFLGFACVALLVVLVHVFWVWMLVDCLMNESSEGNDKLVWALVIVFTSVLGATIYYLVRRPRRRDELGC